MQTSLMLNLRSLIHRSLSPSSFVSSSRVHEKNLVGSFGTGQSERREKKITDHKKEHFEIQKFAYGTFQSGKCVLRGHESKMKE